MLAVRALAVLPLVVMIVRAAAGWSTQQATFAWGAAIGAYGVGATISHLDGISVDETIDNRIGYKPNIDALAEFKIETSNSSAEFGNVTGATVNAGSMDSLPFCIASPCALVPGRRRSARRRYRCGSRAR